MADYYFIFNIDGQQAALATVVTNISDPIKYSNILDARKHAAGECQVNLEKVVVAFFAKINCDI